MRTGVLLAELADDSHLHVPQDAAHDAVAAATSPRAPAAHHALRRQVLVFDIQRVPDTTTASQRRHQRTTRLSVLPADVQLLLLAEKALSRQAREVGHSVRVRILPTAVPDQKQSDHAQESPAPGLGGGTQASDKISGSRRRHCRLGRHGSCNVFAAVAFVSSAAAATATTCRVVAISARIAQVSNSAATGSRHRGQRSPLFSSAVGCDHRSDTLLLDEHSSSILVLCINYLYYYYYYN